MASAKRKFLSAKEKLAGAKPIFIGAKWKLACAKWMFVSVKCCFLGVLLAFMGNEGEYGAYGGAESVKVVGLGLAETATRANLLSYDFFVAWKTKYIFSVTFLYKKSNQKKRPLNRSA